MYSQWLIFLILIIWSAAERSEKGIVLRIGALFDSEQASIENGRPDLQAALMAIDDINSRQEDLFNGTYTLELLANHSRCDPIYAVDAFFHAIFRRPQLHFLVGTSCSNETKAVVQVADYYNLLLLSHSTSFISQINQSDFTLVRLSVSDENFNDARVAFIKSNNWSNVAIIHQDSTEHSLMMAKLAKRLNESNVNVLLTQSASWSNLTSALYTLQEKKARIVFVNFDTSSRAIFFCEVYRTFDQELRERYVWILTENDYHHWNLSVNNCTKRDILEAARGHFIIDSSYERQPSLINPNRTAHELQHDLRLKQHLDRQTLHAYDAIWVIALLIRASMEQNIVIDDFTYDATNVRDTWLTLIDQIHFLGVSKKYDRTLNHQLELGEWGPVSFRKHQREAETIISQFQIDHNRTHIRTIAKYSHLTGFYLNCSKCQSLIWPDTIPVDTEQNVARTVVLTTSEIILITVACLLGLALAIFFLTFNIIYRHERYIKLSSPKLNNVLVIGAMHIHIALLLFALDQWSLKYSILGHVCMLRIFLFSGGFSLTFGSMFLKTLRVYRIFTSHDRPLLHSKLLQDQYLLLICLYLYSMDFVCAFSWQLVDPHVIEFSQESITRLNMDTTVTNNISYCSSKYRRKILPFIYFYKSLFLIVGGYLAAKTRHVHIAALNDSKFIVWSIYIVVLTSLFTVIVMISIQNLHTYVVLSFVVIIMTSVIICLVFLPKVLKLNHRRRDEVVSKDLYMDNSRTRRLAVEISYFEAYRYAQLQNRELKSELIRLNQILAILQQKLDSTSSNVAIALLPLAVRLASTLLQKADVQSSHSQLNSKSSLETITPKNEDCTSSNDILFDYDQSFSSSSDLNLSTAFQSLSNISSLSLTAFDDQPESTIDDEETISLTSTHSISENDSVLYSRLCDEVKITEATLDSDLDRIER